MRVASKEEWECGTNSGYWRGESDCKECKQRHEKEVQEAYEFESDPRVIELRRKLESGRTLVNELNRALDNSGVRRCELEAEIERLTKSLAELTPKPDLDFATWFANHHPETITFTFPKKES